MYTKHILVTLLFFVSLVGCQTTVKTGRSLTEVLEHEGIERTYHIYLPSNFSADEPTPLVIALHGGGGQGRHFDRGTTRRTLIAAAEERDVVVVFPEGINKKWCDGRLEHLNTNRTCTDVAFIAEIIDVMVQNYGIEPRQVYATGISNGGFMSVRLAIDLSEKIAAVAPVTAQLPKALEDKTPNLPVSIMVVNGTEDPIVPYDGGHVRLFDSGQSRGEILSTDATIEQFRHHNGCDSSPERFKLTDNIPDDGTTIEIAEYTNCEADTEVILVKVIGGGHTWPGGNQYLSPKIIGKASQEINASEMILDFFLDHSLPPT